MIKLAITVIITILYLSAIGQTGKLSLNITLTSADTSYPYFLRTQVKWGDSVVRAVEITGSGLYHFGSYKEGVYSLELYDYKSKKLTIDPINIKAGLTTIRSISYPDSCRYIYPKNYKPVCPKGHSDSIVSILYGLPTNRAMDKAKKGLIYLGGCIVSDCDPQYYCNKHKLEF